MNKSLEQVSQQLNIPIQQVSKTLDLLKEGATVPFIARYRKSITGGLDEEQIEKINNLYTYSLDLNKRKEAIIDLLTEKSLITDELKSEIMNAKTKAEVESIYAPFKVGKKTKATEAIELGLEPLALKIFNETDPNFNPLNEAKKYINEKVTSIDFAIENAKLIIAQYISTNIKARNIIKQQIINFGFIETKKKKNAEEIDTNGVFKNYYESSEKISRIKNHRVLAVARAESLKIIAKKFKYDDKKIKYELNNLFFKIKTTGNIIRESMEDALKRLMFPSIEREVWNDLFAKAETSSIELFSNNLEQMLLHPAIKDKVIMAIDPAYVSGCKIAVLSKSGEPLSIDIIYPTPPKKQIFEASKIVNELIDKFNVNIVVIGNGTASRETEKFIADTLGKRRDQIPFAVVSEVGASVYSASKIAIDEFPELSVEQRSAISIGRRFQDPLNELVKIDPKSIGIGQYQHDVNQSELQKALNFKTSKVVNMVGVDINTATKEILTHISGLSNTIAKNIIEYRNENGAFKARTELKKVKGLGPKAYEQAIGFIRIFNSKEPLDATNIHPESYKLAKEIMKKYNNEDLQSVNIDILADEFNANKYDAELIVNALTNPGKDIRDSKDGFILKTDVLEFKDLQEGMEMEGTVQNITDFGAFIYIGIKEAALIHISNLSDKYVSHPSEIVKTGQRVSIEIISIEKDRKRIQAKLIN